jgi:hypothetical protein
MKTWIFSIHTAVSRKESFPAAKTAFLTPELIGTRFGWIKLGVNGILAQDWNTEQGFGFVWGPFPRGFGAFSG